jgi:hypothetical protein
MAHACRFFDLHEKLSRWTRSLKINFSADGEQLSNLAVEAAVTIALHSRRLAELDVVCFAPPEGLLAAVASVASTSLRVLDLSVRGPGIPAGMMSCIGTFPRLHTLTLRLSESDQTIPSWLQVLGLDDLGGWMLRELEKLEIDFEELSGHDHHLQLLRFLSRCVLGKPNRLHLILWGLVSEDAAALEDFFHVHTALCQLKLFEGQADISDVALMHADTEYLMLQSLPSTHTAMSFSPRLRTFCFAGSCAGEFAPLEFLMTALADHRSPDAEPLEFQVMYLGGRRFRWTDEHLFRAADLAQDQAALLGRMCFCAHRLRPRGLVVVDGNGYTVEGSRFERLGADIFS